MHTELTLAKPIKLPDNTILQAGTVLTFNSDGVGNHVIGNESIAIKMSKIPESAILSIEHTVGEEVQFPGRHKGRVKPAVEAQSKHAKNPLFNPAKPTIDNFIELCERAEAAYGDEGDMEIAKKSNTEFSYNDIDGNKIVCKFKNGKIQFDGNSYTVLQFAELLTGGELQDLI